MANPSDNLLPRQPRATPRFSLLELFLIAAVLLLAGALRVAAPGMTEFKADEARLLALALDMADGRFALRGISSSVGFPNFPASVWVYALPSLIWPHPYAATLFTGLLNTAAVGGCYWFVRRYWDVTAALAATLMLAVSPWAVIFSRKIWAQNLLPLFVLGWAIGAALALVEERPRFIWLHLVALALAVQIHLSAVALVPATLVLLLVFRRRVRWRSVLVGLLLAALTVLPFALYLSRQAGEGGLDPAGLLAGRGAGMLSADSWLFTTMISLGTNLHSLAGPEVFHAYLARVPAMPLVHWFWGVFILAGGFLLAWQAWRRWTRPSAQVGLLVLVWLLMPGLFFFWHSTPVFLHYFIVTLPAPYIAAGVAFSLLPRALAHWWPAGQRRVLASARALFALLLLLSAALQVHALLALYGLLQSTATPGGFGVPLGLKLEAVAMIRQVAAETGAGEVLVAGPGEYPETDDFAAEWDVLLRGVPHRFVDVRQSALFPAQSAVVLLDAQETTPTWMGDLYMAAAGSRETIPLRPGEGAYEVLALPAEARPAPDVPVDPPHLLANWVNLLGHDRWRRVDDRNGLWQLHWRTGDNPDPAHYQFFNHLLDGDGRRVSQVDAAAFRPDQWRAGDTLISRFLVPWPADVLGPLTMRAGMYHFPSLDNVPLLDVAGNPYVDAATFPLHNSAHNDP